MKWRKETRAYMWADYFSEDGKWKAWDEDISVKTNRRSYNPNTRKFEQVIATRQIWKLQNLETGEILDKQFKTLREAKQYAEELEA